VLLVNQYNELMDQQRFAEAEVIASQASELAPTDPLVQQLRLNSRAIRRFYNNLALKGEKEQGFFTAMDNVDKSSIAFDDNTPYVLPGPKEWAELTDRRGRRRMDERRRNRTEQEWIIEQKLKTPVALKFKDAPLGQVLDHLAQLTGVNMFLDARGLAEEGVSSDALVTFENSNEIMLKSALNLILQQHGLGYVIKDEVLKITSDHQRQGEVYTVSYTVADLIVPIPNFVPTSRMGLEGALQNAYAQIGYGSGGFGGGGGSTMPVLANAGGANANMNPNVLAQMGGPTAGLAGGGAPGGSMPIGFGPGGLGGGSQADFTQLMELIQSTIDPTGWADAGGEGSIAPFDTNLSLVVSQTQEVHEEIVELLEQLRRMQDLQVTIEVRFITLNDNFFERIGVDFDFDIDDDIDRPYQLFGRTTGDAEPGGEGLQQEPPRNVLDQDHDRSVTVGMGLPGVFTADLDIPFRQDSFGLAIPQFGGFNATAGASLGFAILSDIEAFFFINAAQGDTRSNVLQAPKVTLFNGQQAFVSDTSQSPFVTSVVPVVGDFAAAQQPVIVVLSEGTYTTVQAVVSADRRYVRLTVVPFFSKIGAVKTFTFNSSETSTTDTNSGIFVDDTPDSDDSRIDSSTDRTIIERSGTTVQLPTFSFVTVTTTVSVPDGGTVLLGGIKRLSEGRNEFGVPILNKIPYINRLFKNVGIGRETQTLMMMVTPRIIIQEEEEEKHGA
jgi:general secretion pathway protein D